jgi:hypothetical protein
MDTFKEVLTIYIVMNQTIKSHCGRTPDTTTWLNIKHVKHVIHDMIPFEENS